MEQYGTPKGWYLVLTERSLLYIELVSDSYVSPLGPEICVRSQIKGPVEQQYLLSSHLIRTSLLQENQ